MVCIAGCVVFLVLELAMVAKFAGNTNQAGLSAGGDQSLHFSHFMLD